jgi:Fe-S cluster biosynthesis and repair protein YggX
MMREISRLKKSYTKVDGKRTGFEGDVIGREFTHNNNESMIKWDAGKYVEYMFFINNRFWKRLRTFRKDSFAEDITFDDFVSTLVGRFGDGKEMFNDRDQLAEMKWQNKDTLAVAEDRSDMFGVYSLSFIAKVTNSHLSRLRTHKAKDGDAEKGAVSPIVSTVTSGDVTDRHSNVVDDYTGGDTSSSSANLSFGPEKQAGGEAAPQSADEPPKETKKKDQLDDLDLF